MINKTAELTKKVMQANIDFLQDLMDGIDEKYDIENGRLLCVAFCMAVYIQEHLMDDSKKAYAEITDEK